MATKETKLNKAIWRLARVLGVATGIELRKLSQGLGDAAASAQIKKQARDQHLLKTYMDFFRSSAQPNGTPSIAMILNAVKQTKAGTDSDQLSIIKMLGDKLSISFEPLNDGGGENDGWSFKNTGITQSYDASYEYLPKDVKDKSPVSIKKICKNSSTAGSSVNINKRPATPTTTSPNMAVIQIHDVKNSLTTRDIDACTVFLNSVPSIQMSMAVPYFKLSLISTYPHKDELKARGIGLSQTILGQGASMNKNTPAWIMTTAKELSTLSSLSAGGQSSSSTDQSTLNIASMEMFTTPQTLIPLDMKRGYPNYVDPADYMDPFKTPNVSSFQPPGQSNPNMNPTGARVPPILDPFRPLASIEEFTCEVAPSYGTIALKKATLSIKVHDRSRMHELAPLLSPATFSGGNVKVAVEWGWSHPSADANHADNLNGNAYADLINSLRCKDIFFVTNSAMSFDDSGQVSIDVSLKTTSGPVLDKVRIGLSDDITSQYKGVGSTIEAIKALRAQSNDSPKGKSITSSNFLSGVSSVQGALTLDNDVVKEAQKFVQRYKESKGASPTAKKLASLLYGLYGAGSNNKKLKRNGQIQKLKGESGTIAKAIAKKVNSLRVGGDPWLERIGHVNSKGSLRSVGGVIVNPKVKSSKNRTHVSLAKILNCFVGMPIAASQMYEEIQFIYYNANSKASFVASDNLAGFPIHIDNFKKLYRKHAIKIGPNMTVGTFMSFIKEYFVSSQSCDVYGLQSLYSLKENGYKLKEKYEDQNTYQTELKKKLLAAYGNQGDTYDTVNTELVFNLPRLTYAIETIPMLKTPGSKEDEKTIFRIHIYDAQATPNEPVRKMLISTYNDHIGAISSTASKATSSRKAGDGKDRIKSDLVAWCSALKSAYDAGVVAPLDSNVKPADVRAAFADVANNFQSPSVYESFKKVQALKFQPRGGFYGMKRFLSYMMPTLHIGADGSNIISADLASMTNSLISTVISQRGLSGGSTVSPTQGAYPLQLAPLKSTLETVGNPLISHGQEYFVDFKTGTSADNVYRLHKVSHSIGPGGFTTSMDLINIDIYGKIQVMSQHMDDMLAVIKHLEPKKSGGSS